MPDQDETPRLGFVWHNPERIGPLAFVCWFCSAKVAGNEGYWGQVTSTATMDGSALQGRIYTCPYCSRPNFFVGAVQAGSSDFRVGFRAPSAAFGERVGNLPSPVEAVYEEARRCMTVDGYAATVMLCRTLLMHVAVERGAPPGKSFEAYVDYLIDNGYVAPTNKSWVDEIRKVGNEANHELAPRTKEQAENLVEFAEMLLKTVYEYPARAK